MDVLVDTRPVEDPLAPQRRSAIVGGVLGNHVDQLNIFLPVVALTPALSHLAGPSAAAGGTALVVMATLLGRPVGAIVFGRLADKLGRTRTTSIAIAGTAACSLLIGCLPPHTLLGAWTFILLVALRFVGGAFLAGEYSAAIPLAMEWSRPRRRGLISGLIMSMAPSAQALIAFVTAGLLAVMGPDDYGAWGWRLCFWGGGLASVAMLVFYRRKVADATLAVVPGAGTPGRRGSLRDVVLGEHRAAFWRMVVLMTGLWCMTNMVVIVLTARLATDQGLRSGQVAVVMGLASVAQALVMAVTGHLSTVLGRRRYFVVSGLVAAVAGPTVWLAMMGAPHGVVALAAGAAAIQVLTVCTYGPVGAYLSEGFPEHVRSVGYGTAYSASIVLPALYPWWLPSLSGLVGRNGAVGLVLVVGGLLVAVAAALGPRLSPSDIEERIL